MISSKMIDVEDSWCHAHRVCRPVGLAIHIVAVNTDQTPHAVCTAPSEDDRAAVRSCVLSALRRFASDESEDEHYAWAGHTLIIPRWEIYPADIVILTLPDAGKTKIGVDRTVLTQKLKANRWTKIENGSKRRLALVEPADGGLLTADDSPYHQIVAGLTPLPGHEPGAGFDPTGCSTFTPYVDGGPRAWQLA